MDEEKSIKELEQETANKKKTYESLLKENLSLNKIYQKNANAAVVFILSMLFACISLFVGLFPLGAAMVIACGIFSYRCDKHFELLFEETASIELKMARKDYEEYKGRLKEVEKARKEKRAAEVQAELQQVKEQSALNTERRASTHNSDDETEEDEIKEGHEIFIKMMTGLYNRELISSHPVYTGDLTDTIYKNTFAAQSFLDKAVVLVGDIIRIDYDKHKNMPYVLIGSGHYISSSDVCDRYACYFVAPAQIAALEKLQVGDMLTICGIFGKNNYEKPSTYILTQSYILAIK